jgi:hypothetical protein
MDFIPPVIKKTAVIANIHCAQMKYFILFALRPTGFSLIFEPYSCKAPPGHTHPQNALPQNNEKTKRKTNRIKLPVTIPAKLPL